MTQNLGTVALVTPRYAPAKGGVERHVEMLATRLVRRGLAVEVITTDPTGRLPPIEERDGVIVRRFPTLRHDDVYFISPGLGRWLLRNARRYGLLHAHSYHTPLALNAAVAARMARVPLVVTPLYHGTGHSALRRALHVPYRPAGAWLLRQARRVICLSQTERQLLHHHFGTHIRTAVIPSGVDPQEFLGVTPVEATSGRALVLAAGRLEQYKQTDRLVAALEHLPAHYGVAIIGAGPARPTIERIATRLAVTHRVRMLGQVSRCELAAWYRAAGVFVSLSRFESFGLTLLEAAAAGTVIVASDIPAHREVAQYIPGGRVSFVSPNCSPLELARAIQQAQDRRQELGTDTRLLPTWEQTTEATIAQYRSVLGYGLPTPCGMAI